MWLVGWHHELHIRPRFVDKVIENRAGDDVGGCESAVPDGRSDDGHTPVLFQFLEETSILVLGHDAVIIPRPQHPAYFSGRRSFLCWH